MLLRALPLCLLSLLLLAPGSTRAQQPLPAPPEDYRVLITRVDSSAFPQIRVEFKVLAEEATGRPWDPTMPLQVVETVRLEDGHEDELEVPGVVPQLCGLQPVAFGVAVDISGSVDAVKREIGEGVEAIFRRMHREGRGTPPAMQDLGALIAFSTDLWVRFPAPPAGVLPASASMPPPGGMAASPDLYVGGDGLLELAEAAGNLPVGGGSPIWEGMRTEADLLASHDPSRAELVRVLVTFTDGVDNASADSSLGSLRRRALAQGVRLVNLGYGTSTRRAHQDLTSLAVDSGGLYVRGVAGRVEEVLNATLDGYRKTWCLEYTSPHRHRVNLAAQVGLRVPGGEGKEVYPLPLVVAEDSRDARLFLPVSEATYRRLGLDDPATVPEPVLFEAQLKDADGYPWKPRRTADGGRGPDRPARRVSVASQAWVTGTPGDPLSGWGILVGDDSEEWNRLFRVPTDPVSFVDAAEDLDREGRAQHVDGVSHWVLTGDLAQVVPGPRDPRRGLPLHLRLAVQDRTPPSLRVRVLQRDGEPPMELRLVPDAVDQDPEVMAHAGPPRSTREGVLLEGYSAPSYAAARRVEAGAKRARLEYRWRRPDGARGQGRLGGQRWSLRDEQGLPAFRVQDHYGDWRRAVEDDGGGVLDPGLLVTAGVRATLQVAARDNLDREEASPDPLDREVFTDPEEDGVARHARFDTASPAANPGDEEAPYLPFLSRSEQEAAASVAGVTWWIDSQRPDHHAGVEGVTELRYTVPDRRVGGLARSVVDADPERFLKIRARDRAGNVTVLEIPVGVIPSGFHPRLLHWETRRVGLTD